MSPHGSTLDGPLLQVRLTRAQHNWLTLIAAREGRSVQEQVAYMIDHLSAEPPGLEQVGTRTLCDKEGEYEEPIYAHRLRGTMALPALDAVVREILS